MGSNQSSMANQSSMCQFIIQSLYCKEDGADVWFSIDGERIPGHQWVLKTVVPLYQKDLTNDCNEIHLSGVSVDAFKEFLKFIHLRQPNLTIGIIEGVMDMANRWQSKLIFKECKQFLKNSIKEKSTLFLGYRLAAKYRLKDLKAIYLEEICVNADVAFQSDSFLTLPYECMVEIFECDSLACKEIDIFNACINWAKAARRQNDWNAFDGQKLRIQLGSLLHQIRFNSMTNEEAAKCIDLHPQLFTEDELQEILCMIGHLKPFKPKQFNWTGRYYNLNGKSDLICSRVRRHNNNTPVYDVENREQITKFTCSRRIELHGIECEWFNQTTNCRIPIQIIEEDRSGQRNLRCNGAFERNSNDEQRPATGYFPFEKSIILRPNYTYEIHITFPNLIENSHSSRRLKEEVRVDHDIVFRFRSTARGVVTSLKFRRFKNRNFFRKIIYNPTLWIWMLIAMIILGSITAFYIWPSAFYVFLFLLFLVVLCLCCC